MDQSTNGGKRSLPTIFIPNLELNVPVEIRDGTGDVLDRHHHAERSRRVHADYTNLHSI